MSPSLPAATAACLLLLAALSFASVAGAESGSTPAEGATSQAGEQPREPVGGVVLGDPQWRRSHFSAQAQGYGYPSHLVPRSWPRDGGASPARRSGAYEGHGYRGKRYWDARAYRSDRSYARDRFYRDRSYARDRYHRDRSYARDRYFRDRSYANQRY